MNPQPAIVADGRNRLSRALRTSKPARDRRFAELLAQLEQSHRVELERASFVRRLALRRRLRAQADTIVRREFRIPSAGALFLRRA